MENDFNDGTARQEAAALLSNLESDRSGLADRLRKPTWLAPALGLLAAIYIASPGLPETFARGGVLTPLVILSILVMLGYQRMTGVKLLRFRLFEGVMFAIAVLATLFFFSVSLGLAAGGLHWWILASAAAGFLTVTGLAQLGASSMRERVRDVG